MSQLTSIQPRHTVDYSSYTLCHATLTSKHYYFPQTTNMSEKPLSSRISGMKFMQKKEEEKKREKLEAARKIVQQEAQWVASPPSQKRQKFVEMGEVSGKGSRTLYQEHSILAPSTPSNVEVTQEEVLEFKDEVSKLRMGRRTFGSFNPVVEVCSSTDASLFSFVYCNIVVPLPPHAHALTDISVLSPPAEG